MSDQWQPIETAKKAKKGFMRVYSFKPEDNGSRFKLERAYQFCPTMGLRVCDLFMDIPIPPQALSRTSRDIEGK